MNDKTRAADGYYPDFPLYPEQPGVAEQQASHRRLSEALETNGETIEGNVGR